MHEHLSTDLVPSVHFDFRISSPAPRRNVSLMTKRWSELRRLRGVQEVFRIRDGSRPCDGRVEGPDQIRVRVNAGLSALT
jgi:hypothetical protein